MSYYFKLHQQEYYDRLALVRTTGDYEQWVSFFLQGVAATSRSALATVRGILNLQEEMQALLLQRNASSSAMKLMDHLYSVPVIGIDDVQNVCGVSLEEASDMVREFEQWGILEGLGEERYVFKRYVGMFY